MPKNRGARRLRLWKKNPHCYWCGVLTVLPEGEPPFSDNTATLDHLCSKLDNNRRITPKHERTVLSCNKCNHSRGKQEEIDLGNDTLQKRSGSRTSSKEDLIKVIAHKDEIIKHLSKMLSRYDPEYKKRKYIPRPRLKEPK